MEYCRQVVNMKRVFFDFYYSNSLWTSAGTQSSGSERWSFSMNFFFRFKPLFSYLLRQRLHTHSIIISFIFFLSLLRGAVAILWILIFLRLIFMRVYGQVALVSVPIFVIWQCGAMILSADIRLRTKVPSSPAEWTNEFRSTHLFLSCPRLARPQTFSRFFLSRSKFGRSESNSWSEAFVFSRAIFTFLTRIGKKP